MPVSGSRGSPSPAKQSAEHVAALLDDSDAGVVATDPDFVVTVWSPGAEALYGIPEAEMLGHRTREMVAFADEAALARLEAELADGGRSRVELRAQRRDGADLEIEITAVAVRGRRAGGPAGYLAIHRDITEPRRLERERRRLLAVPAGPLLVGLERSADRETTALEAALRASEQRMELVVEGVSEAFYVFDEHARCMYLNTRAVVLVNDLTGRSLAREDLVGRAVADVFPGFAGSDVEAQVRAAAHAHETVVLELPLGRRWFHVHVSPSPHGLAVAVHEITDRKLAEADRRRRELQQSALADLARRAATGDDLQSQLEGAVDLITTRLGADMAFVAEHGPGDDRFRLRALVGGAPAIVGGLLDPAGPGSLLRRAMAQSDVVVCEDAGGMAAVAPGADARALAVCVPGPDAPFGALAVLTRQRWTSERDEGEFLRAVASVLATAAERARRGRALVEVRDAERRRIARALHEEALQDLGHAVSLAAKAMRPGQGEPPALAVLRRVEEHVRAAIHDLRLSEETSRPTGDLLEELAADHRRLAPQWTLELRTRALSARPLGHRGTELVRIVGEALTNARRHADATTVSVRAWVSSGCVWAEVRDDGCGFDPRAPRTDRDRNGLLGMHERAALLGGRVTMTSAPGEGTAVQISVPLGDRADAAERLRLLLVADHATVREAMAAALEAEPDVGDVRQAGSLAEARTMLDDVDVAVIDLRLGDGSGADLIEDVHRRSPDAQTLIITARADRLAAASAIERGAAGVLGKDAHLHDLLSAIRRMRRGEPVMPLPEVVELLRLAGRQREREFDDRRALDSLTPREREVLQLLANGFDNREAAARLHVSPRTHRNHVANILAKLDVHSQLQALLFALRYGAVEIGGDAAL